MEIIVLFLLAVLLSITLAVGGAMALALFGEILADAPFVPVPRTIATRVAALVELPVGGTFFDLGSGEGRVVRAVARAHPNSTAIGIEKAPLPFFLASLKTPRKKYPNVRFVRKDFRDVSLTDASCVFLYLFPNAMEVLRPKLEAELKPGTSVISCDFMFSGLKPALSEKIHAGGRWHTLYMYEV